MVCNSERKPAQPPRQACLPQSKDATADFVTLPCETTLAIGASVWIKPRKPTAARRFVEELHRYPTAVARQCRDRPFAVGEHPADVCMSMQSWLHRSALPSSWDGPLGLYELQLAEQARHGKFRKRVALADERARTADRAVCGGLLLLLLFF